MQSNKIWWFAACDAEVIADFRRRSLLVIEPAETGSRDLGQPGSTEETLRFDQDLSIGDLVLAGNRDDGELLIGEVGGAATSRPGMQRLQSLRTMHWHCALPESACDQSLLDAVREAPVLSVLGHDWHASVKSLIAEHGADHVAEHAANEAPEPLRFQIDCSPPKVALPSLPILYQSPYAERILREFRWREYLLANSDVAATGHGHAHAFGHFFHQGYYERRIFDPQRLQGFDPGHYRERYPELELASDAEAQIHYCYQGWYEQRIPNRDSAWLHDADLHVFQMGKVGSHTISGALREAGYTGRTIHLHWVTDLTVGYPSNQLPYSRILVHERTQPVKVISASREIVSWALSGLFQYHGPSMLNVADATAFVEERFWTRCQDGLRWFDHGYFCGLDVYAHPFEYARGYSRIQHGDIDLLLYRQEDLPRLEAPLADFMALPALRLQPQNVGDTKGYADVYRRVMREFRLPGNLLSTLYDTPFMRHFYSEAERERSYARWVRPD